jgi:hypothetical protein
MRPLAHAIVWFGLLLVVVSGFLPTFHFTAYPAAVTVPVAAPASASTVRIHVSGGREVPAQELGQAVASAVRGPERVLPFWIARRWYPWYLALLWIPALLLVRGRPAAGRRRRLVGAILWAVTLGLLVFEAAYLHAEYNPFLPGTLGKVEGLGAWLFVATILLARRRADRHLGAVEAVVAAQALLGFVHALTLPATMARTWLGQHTWTAVTEAVMINFPLSFWLGTAGLLLIALPTYVRRSG